MSTCINNAAIKTYLFYYIHLENFFLVTGQTPRKPDPPAWPSVRPTIFRWVSRLFRRSYCNNNKKTTKNITQRILNNFWNWTSRRMLAHNERTCFSCRFCLVSSAILERSCWCCLVRCSTCVYVYKLSKVSFASQLGLALVISEGRTLRLMTPTAELPRGESMV